MTASNPSPEGDKDVSESIDRERFDRSIRPRHLGDIRMDRSLEVPEISVAAEPEWGKVTLTVDNVMGGRLSIPFDPIEAETLEDHLRQAVKRVGEGGA